MKWVLVIYLLTASDRGPSQVFPTDRFATKAECARAAADAIIKDETGSFAVKCEALP
jgi:hypothetical protein